MNYGVILNDAASLARIGPLDGAPYKGAPLAPALYLKPPNTLAAPDAPTFLPRGAKSLEIGASFGLLISRPAARLDARTALDFVGGILLSADLSLPHDSYFRPAIREKCFDGSLRLGPAQPYVDPAGISIAIEIDGERVAQRRFDNLLRGPAELLAAVTDYMTLDPGDILLVGVSFQAPQAGAGAKIRLIAENFDDLAFELAEKQS